MPMGAHTNDERPIANRTAALVALTLTTVVENSVAISFAAVNREVLLNVAPNVIQLVTATTVHLRHAG